MGTQYRVALMTDRGAISHTYPADDKSLALIRAAGGRSKLTEEQQAAMVYKRVGPGDDCSDMPKESLQELLALGWVEKVDVPEPDKKGSK